MKYTFFLALICLCNLSLLSQNEVELLPDGIVVPRTSPGAIASPVKGQLIYNNNTDSYYFYDGFNWLAVDSDGIQSIIEDVDGDTSIELIENLIGDEIYVGIDGNTRFGFLSDSIGRSKLVFLGNNGNVAIGDNNLTKNETGSSNIAIGRDALSENETGSSNIAIGEDALKENETGFSNIAIGQGALKENESGGNNTVIGRNAGKDNTASNNTFIGSGAGAFNESGGNNTFIGGFAGPFNTSGVNNTCIGYRSGNLNIVGSDNVFIGHEAGYFESGSNKLYIANQDDDENNALIYGEFDNHYVQLNGDVRIKPPVNTTDEHGLTISSESTIDEVYTRLENEDTGGRDYAFISTGGSSVHGQGKLVLRDETANLNRLVVRNNGRIGIGVDNPGRELHVNGAIRLDGIGSNQLMYAGVDEAIWYNGTYFSWGFDGDYNFFADDTKIGGNGNNAPTHILQINGVGRSTQSTWATSSDIRAKENITTIENAGDLLMQFRPVRFDWKKEYRPESTEREYGFIAQEVEKIIPEMVTSVDEKVGDTTIADFRVLNTSALTPLLVKGYQELAKENAALKTEINEIKTLMENLLIKLAEEE